MRNGSSGAFVLAMVLVLGFSLLFAFRETLRDFRLSFDLRAVRSALRSLIRVRNRDFLPLVIALQVLLGAYLVALFRGESAEHMAIYGAIGLFLCWIVYCAVSDSRRPTASRRWRFPRPGVPDPPRLARRKRPEEQPEERSEPTNRRQN